MLVTKLGIKGKKKLEDRWEESPCVVKAHPIQIFLCMLYREKIVVVRRGSPS